MYLKKIEAQGFKSFANKVVMEFNHGIMGIVGPNGSGKSNVADAVRWVLGEQSAKQLRGGSMQDVIFSGTEARKPMGYAYVALTLDNGDMSLPIEYPEVTVSRQVFRSGESEYRINGNICRLRDVYELFYDSGIGKEGYSIIGQGQIDKVLSNKPEERRLMFDEAAGITKYKKRKEITAKKLDSERQSLQRISDILGELERQVGPLEKQSAKARSYLKLKDELKAYEVGAFYLQASDLERKLTLTRKNLEIVGGDLMKSHEEAEALKAHYDSLSEMNDELDEKMQEARQQLTEEKVDQENKEGRIALLKEQLSAIAKGRSQAEERKAALAAQQEKIREERDEFFRQKNEINRQLDAADDKITRLEGEAEAIGDDIRAAQFQIDQKNKGILAAMDEKVSIAGDLEGMHVREQEVGARLSAVKEALASAQSEQDEKEGERRALALTLRDMESAVEEQSAALTALRSRKRELEPRVRELRQSSAEAAQNLGILRNRRENLLNLTERYEGFGGSVRKIMEQKHRFPGVKGVVADLISTDKRYETALETALGGRLQNVVTDTEDTAKTIINFLKAEKLGRVTFLPVDAVKGEEKFPRPEALKEDGALGRASELVEAEPSLAGVVNFLLGQVLVVSTMDKALKIARKYGYRLHLVTLEGEYLAPGGSISGGSFKNNSSLLGRRRELEELTAAAEKAEGRARKLSSELRAGEEELEELARKEESTAPALESLKLKRTALATQAEAFERENQKSRESYEALTAEREALEATLQEIGRKREETLQRSGSLEKDNESRQQEVTKSLSLLEKHKMLLEEKQKALEAERLEFAGLSQKDGFLLENIRRLNESLKASEEELERVLSGRGLEQEEIDSRNREIAELEQQVAEHKAAIQRLDKTLDEDRELREKQRGEQQGFFASREEIAGKISDLDKESFRLQSMEQRLTEQMEQQAQYLWEEYEMTPSEAKETRNPELTNLTEVHRFISQKKNEIRSLGPVNVSAIEEYKEVAERYEFMKTQHDDLVKAEEELVDMIDEMDEEMRQQFRTQFARIQEEFSKTFADLFAGGKGNLLLEEGVDVLDAGVIINAQPPGKKLVNMMQLSGGEKALTAIALLFAIQNLKPSPFCLLDEIEAALDEPNVARFANYLNRLKDTTQFIVITHRRGTMEMTDRLYGITMQEKGVSALVSVNLKDPSAGKYIDEQ